MDATFLSALPWLKDIAENHYLGICISVIVVYSIYSWRSSVDKLRKTGLKGPQCYPVIGTAHEILKDKGQLHLTLDRLLKKHGDVFTMYFFSQPSTVIADPKLIHAVNIKEHNKFQDRPSGGIEVPEPMKSMLTSLKGERWKNVRKVLSPAFTSGKLKKVTSIMNKTSATFVQKLSEFADKDKTVDFYGMLQNVTLDVILQAAFGIDSNCQLEPNGTVSRCAREAANPKRWMRMTILIPFIGKQITKWLMPTKYGNGLGSLNGIAGKVIKERQRKWKDGERQKDMLGMTIDTQLSGSEKITLTDNEVLGQAVIFLFAGFDTTSIVLSMLCYHLAIDQDIQGRLHEEIISVFGDGPVEYDQLSELTFLDALVSEVLRLYPPGFMTGRNVKEDCVIEGVNFNKGTGVIIPIYSLHRDERYWKNPLEFDPERFMPGNTINQSVYLPFGSGPRNCIGMRFAQLEIRYVMSELIRKYRILPAEDLCVPMKIVVKNILTVGAPVNVRVVSR